MPSQAELKAASEVIEAYAKEWWEKQGVQAPGLPETVAEMPFTQTQRKLILMHMAQAIWFMAIKLGMDTHSKSYDPLTFEPDADGVVHSYVLNLSDGGRHHDYDSLKELEKLMMAEFATWFSVGDADALEMPVQKLLGARFNGVETVFPAGTEVSQMKMEG